MEVEDARGAGLVDGARHEVAVAALEKRPVGRDQRAAPMAGLHDDRCVGEAADQPVALGERPLRRAPIGEHLGHDDSARRHDLRRETDMGAGVEAAMAGPEDRHGRTPGGDDGRVGGAVDPHRQARHHHAAGLGDRPGDPRRDQAATSPSTRRTGGGRSIARRRAG